MFTDFAKWLLDLLIAFLGWFFDCLKSFLFNFAEILFNWVISKIESISFGLTGYPLDLQWTSDFYSSLNFFCPINETIAILSVLLMLWISCWVLKVVLKAIPTVY